VPDSAPRCEIRERIVDAVGEAGAAELLDVLTRPDADHAALIGRLHQREDAAWLAELLIDLEEDEPGAAAAGRTSASAGASWPRHKHQVARCQILAFPGRSMVP
jgi:hypothetical protein